MYINDGIILALDNDIINAFFASMYSNFLEENSDANAYHEVILQCMDDRYFQLLQKIFFTGTIKHNWLEDAFKEKSPPQIKDTNQTR